MWLNLPQNAPEIYGCGRNKTILGFPNAKDGETQFHVTSNSDFYDFVLKGFTFKSTHNGTLLKIGQDDYRDPLNVARIEDLAILNDMPGVMDSCALHLNYVVNSKFGTVRANCFANGQGANYGTALRMRQASFNHFSSTSFGNASRGIMMQDGYSYGNVFTANDTENVNIGIDVSSPNAVRNSFHGGQYSLFTDVLVNCPYNDVMRVKMDTCNIQVNPGARYTSGDTPNSVFIG